MRHRDRRRSVRIRAMSAPRYRFRIARTGADRVAAFRLRHDVFVAELGARLGDPETIGLETDAYDLHCDHLLLLDENRAAPDRAIAVCRVLHEDAAARAGQFYSESEYDIAPLRRSGRRLMELGRSCVHPDHRGGAALHALWTGLAAHVERRGIDVIFGVASFHGTDPAALAEPLSILHHRHLAPPGMRVTARPPGAVPMDVVPEDRLDRARAMRAVPSLIKTYLKLGGWVGDGAFVDHGFNTTDVCLVMDTGRLNLKQSALYGRPGA